MILAFEESHRTHSGRKETAIHETFGLSSSRYYQLLNALLLLPAAELANPTLVRALIRARNERMNRRDHRVF